MNPPQMSPKKPPLITPSASPPPRPSHVYNRLPGTAPPLKKQRLISTPHRASHDTSSSISRPQSPADVQKEREASKHRLLDVWSSLAERYTRRLDQDDIVDIRTGEITLDRGFLRKSRKIDFGAIAAPATGDATADEGTDEDEEDVYDTDELDAFADTTSDAGRSEMRLRVRPVPPVNALDSVDAEDLRAFLEAEQRRKQLCGSDVEEDDRSNAEIQSQGSEAEDESVTDFEDPNPFLLDNDNATDACETASEDELDNWDIDESSVVYPVVKREDNDSDIEIIDGPTPSSLNSARNHSTPQSSPTKSISTSNFRTPTNKPYVLLTSRKLTGLAKSTAERQKFNKDSRHVTLREGTRSPPNHSFSTSGPQSPMPRKRKRTPSDSGTVFAVENLVMTREEKSQKYFTPRRTSFSDDLSYHQNKASTSYRIPDENFVKSKLTRRSSPRPQRPRPMPGPSVSSSGSESGNSSGGEQGYSHKPARLPYNNFQSPHHYHHSHHHQSYTPHRKQQHYPPPPEMFAPPIPDPHAQFIITQAMQQLSALVNTWIPSHDSSSIPYTPSRRHQSRRANSVFNTPSYHPHPYPYSYNPNLSLATLPPESPELASSPEKSTHGPRKSSMARSRSRGRRVSFKIDDDESGDSEGGRGRVDIYSSPSNIPSSRRKAVKEQGRQNNTKSSEGKGKARAETPNSESSSDGALDCGNNRDGNFYLRGRTPGPNIGPPKSMKRGQGS